jgi:integrase
MARLGMRAGEVRQLKLDDINLIEGVIHVRVGKSRRERTLPLFEDDRGRCGLVWYKQEGENFFDAIEHGAAENDAEKHTRSTSTCVRR